MENRKFSDDEGGENYSVSLASRMKEKKMVFPRLFRWTLVVPLLLTLLIIIFMSCGKNESAEENEENDFPALDPELKALISDISASRDDKLGIEGPENLRKMENSKELTGKAWKNGNLSENHGIAILTDIFHRADTDQSGLLDFLEMSSWILQKIFRHIDDARAENFDLFRAIDANPRDGKISWDEFHAHSLRSFGLPESYVLSHSKMHSKLTRRMKEAVQRDRARWSEAARTDTDFLTAQEFYEFAHPENSPRLLLKKADEFIEKYDQDGDGKLSKVEWKVKLADNPDHKILCRSIQNKFAEMLQYIDVSKDGFIDRKELVLYSEPTHPRHAFRQVAQLLVPSDANSDRKLSLEEVLANAELFLSSKFVDAEEALHDEF